MLKLTEPNKALGTIKYGQPLTFYVGVQNPTDNDIHVNAINVGCGRCTTASMSNAIIKAHSTEQLKVVYTPNSTGYTPKTVTLNNSLVLNFNATVVA